MKIYTSYFAKTKQLEEQGIIPIGICAFPPNWFNGVNLASVAPTNDILFEYKANPNEERYIQRYQNEVLVILKDPKILIERIEYISKGKDVALCCYEKPTDFCHRHLLAQFLNEKLGLEIEEFPFKEDKVYVSEELF